MQREGPGLLLRDILKGESPDVTVAANVISHVAPDILLLTGFDHDHEGAALTAFAERLTALGADYPYRFASAPNTGLATGLDLDGDGRVGSPRDAQGYGRFRGQGGMALLSRWPIEEAALQDLSTLLWRDLPGALPPDLPAEVEAVQRLSTTAHWDVPILTPAHGAVRILAFHASPPVFDGPEDRNGRRNHDEAALWLAWLNGSLEGEPPIEGFVLLGDANLDPLDGDGRPGALRSLLDDPRLQDPAPRSAGGILAAQEQGGANVTHFGDPALDTADWDDDAPGNLRVDYVLPSADWRVVGSGVFWPAPDDPLAGLVGNSADGVSRHRLVWVDIDRP